MGVEQMYNNYVEVRIEIFGLEQAVLIAPTVSAAFLFITSLF